VNPLFQLFFDIARLRATPQRVPYSLALLWVVLGTHLGLGTLLGLTSAGLGDAIAAAALSTALVPLLLGLVLALTRHLPRLVQAATAMAGVEALLMVATLPLALWLQLGLPSLPASLVSTLLITWNLVANAFILRESLEVDWVLGGVTAVMFLFVSFYFINLLVPAPATGG